MPAYNNEIVFAICSDTQLPYAEAKFYDSKGHLPLPGPDLLKEWRAPRGADGPPGPVQYKSVQG